MPEILRALVVVLAIAMMVFALAKNYAVEIGINQADFVIRRNAWLMITCAAFLTNNFWIFCFITILVLWRAKKHDSNPVALMFFVLYAVPLFKMSIPGFGLFNQLFELDYFRLLVLVILLPIYFEIRKNKETLNSHIADKLLILYLIYTIALYYEYSTLTNIFRIIFEYFLDIFLPYIVASRYLKNTKQFNDIFISIIIASIIVGLIGLLETLKGWMLYSNVPGALGNTAGVIGYLFRGNSLRAAATSGQPIVLGFMLMVSFGFYLHISQFIKNNNIRVFIFCLLGLGLIAPLSRGPWLGTIVILIAFIILGPKPSAKIMKLLFLTSITFLLLLLTPYGSKIIDLLPFVGTVDAENVTFRQNLLTNSMIVMERNLFFGSLNVLTAPELEAMRAGGDGGIIDVVNNYLAIALLYGLVGLSLFIAFFCTCSLAVLKGIKFYQKDKQSGLQTLMLGNTLLATLAGVLFTIYTVSSISFIPILYWFLGGFCIAYHNLVMHKTKSEI